MKSTAVGKAAGLFAFNGYVHSIICKTKVKKMKDGRAMSQAGNSDWVWAVSRMHMLRSSALFGIGSVFQKHVWRYGLNVAE
jgi:hypothetical protein